MVLTELTDQQLKQAARPAAASPGSKVRHLGNLWEDEVSGPISVLTFLFHILRRPPGHVLGLQRYLLTGGHQLFEALSCALYELFPADGVMHMKLMVTMGQPCPVSAAEVAKGNCMTTYMRRRLPSSSLSSFLCEPL